jgi:hypothetical protein
MDARPMENSEQTIPRRGDDFIEERQLVEHFATCVVNAHGDACLSVVLLPWSQQEQSPAGVLCPNANGILDAQQLQDAFQSKNIALVACTFTFPEEERAAALILPQLLAYEGKCILYAHLLPPSVTLDRQGSQRISSALERMMQTRVHDVLFDPSTEPTALRLRIKMAHHTWTTNQQQMAAVLAQEPAPPTEEEINELEHAHMQLLWEDIPRNLMPHFSAVNPDLVETENMVGDYDLVTKMQTAYGTVWEAVSLAGVKLAIKFIDKLAVNTPAEVECVNREYRFLKGYVEHPNIIRAVDFLHSPKFVYIVFDYAGDQHIAQYLEATPGHRMDAGACFGCFGRIASAVAHLHEKDITHRSISLEHVVLNQENLEKDGYPVPKLCDFHFAMVAKPGFVSRTICGKFPCMAPDMLLGQPYAPLAADCWSTGVLLLEMLGGMGSFVEALGLTEQETESIFQEDGIAVQMATANKILAYFSNAGSHSRALACVNGVQNEKAVPILSGLLQSASTRPHMYQICLDGNETCAASSDVVPAPQEIEVEDAY